MTGFALLFLAAAGAYGMSRWLCLPVIPFLLGAGWLLSVAGHTPADAGLRGIGELGLTFLVFASGVELNPARFAQQRRPVFWVASVQFLCVGLIGFGLTRAMGFDGRAALYLGLGLSASSTLVVVRHLKQRQQMFEPFGRTVTGVLLLQDVAMILAIVAMSRLDEGSAAMVRGVGGAALLGAFAFGGNRFVMPRLIRWLGTEDEPLLLTVLGVLFGFAGLAVALELPMVAGAFFAGFALASTPTNGVTRGLIGSLSDFFLAVTFTAIGALIQVPDAVTVWRALVLAGLVFLVTPPLVTVIAEWKGLTSRTAIESGLLLAQTSEFTLVLALSGLSMGHIDTGLFTLLALTTAITITLTPFIATDAVTWRLLHYHPVLRRIDPAGAPSGHVLVLGFGSGGMWMIKPLLAKGMSVMVVDDDPAIIGQLTRAAIPCLRGDGSDARVLAKAGAREARLILASMRRVEDAVKVLRFAPGVPTAVRVFEQTDAGRVRQCGGIPILNSEAAADMVMEWIEKCDPKHARPS